MAKAKSKGSILLEVLIVILVVALIATILYPKKIWDKEERNTEKCRTNMDRIFKAEITYLKYNNTYTDSVEKLISFFKQDTTKEVIRDYIMIDTALAEIMTDYLINSDSVADLVVRNLLADTLMYAIIEAINYDSNLARVMLNRLKDTPLADPVRAKRAISSDNVAILKEMDTEFPAIKIYEPIKDDDSLKLIFNRMMPEVSTGSLLDTLYALNNKWAQKIDSAIFFTIDDFRSCPTITREYSLSVIDTSVIKYINVECPIDSADIKATKANFIQYHLGHHRIENHGKIETGEKNWGR